MQGNGSLKINDDEFYAYKTMISEMAGLLEEKLSAYIYIMQTVCNDGIISGNVHDNLKEYMEAVRLLEGQLFLLSSALGSNIDTFIAEIDELDKNLYYGY